MEKVQTHKFKILAGILGILVFATAVFGGYKLGQKEVSFAPQFSPTPAAVATPTPDPTANWKTYTNTKYGYSIKYPPNYFISTTVNRIEFAHNKWKDQVVHHPYVSIEVFEAESSIDEWAEHKIEEKKKEGFGIFEEGCEMHCVSATTKETKIGDNIRALQYSVWGVSGGGDYIVAKKGDTSNWLVVIESHAAGARDPGEESVPKAILDKMLSTFRFLDLISPFPTPRTRLKLLEYKNDNLKIAFSYFETFVPDERKLIYTSKRLVFRNKNQPEKAGGREDVLVIDIKTNSTTFFQEGFLERETNLSPGQNLERPSELTKVANINVKGRKGIKAEGITPGRDYGGVTELNDPRHVLLARIVDKEKVYEIRSEVSVSTPENERKEFGDLFEIIISTFKFLE